MPTAINMGKLSSNGEVLKCYIQQSAPSKFAHHYNYYEPHYVPKVKKEKIVNNKGLDLESAKK